VGPACLRPGRTSAAAAAVWRGLHARLLQRLALAPLRPGQLAHCGQDAPPGASPGLVAGSLQLVGAQGRVQLRVAPVPVEQQLGTEIAIVSVSSKLDAAGRARI